MSHTVVSTVSTDVPMNSMTAAEEVVVSALKKRGLTIGTAESCTGGLLAKRLTDLSGVSQVYNGGIVSYTNQVKHNVLGVSQQLLDTHGAVSAPVAQAMAEGARAVLHCDIALATTGVAGPDRDDRNNPVGTIFVAIATPDDTHVRQLNLEEHATRQQLRTETANHAFDLARRYLSGLPY